MSGELATGKNLRPRPKVARNQSENQPLEVVDVEYWRPDAGHLDFDSASERMRLGESPVWDVDNTVQPAEMLGSNLLPAASKRDQPEDQAAERDTIQNVDSVYSTVIWRQLQDAVVKPPPLPARVDAFVVLNPDVEQGEIENQSDHTEEERTLRRVGSPLMNGAPNGRRNELSQFVNQRLYELDQKRRTLSRLAGIGLILALIAISLFAFWWLGRY